MQINLLDLLEEYGVTLESRGLEYWAKCPFHADSNPSFSVSEMNGAYVWYCFSCKRGGGPVEFLAEIENIPIPEARRRFDEKCGIERDIPQEKQLLTEIVEYLSKDFWGTEGGIYIKNRGFTQEVAENCSLGYCNDMQSLLDHFHLDRTYAYHIGIPRDITRHVIYPFFDYDGCFKIHTRNIDEKQYMTHEGKYWKHSLWGINRIRVHGTESVHLCEGFHDKMAIEMRGLQAVSMQSTTMHPEYWDELYSHGVKYVTFVMDGDHAGREAMVRIIQNYDPRFVIDFKPIPSGDPDEAIFENRFDQIPRVTMLEWYVGYKWKDLTTLSNKVKMYKDISKFYVKLHPEDKVLTKQYFKEKFGDDEALDYLYFDVQPDFRLERVVIANCLYSEDIKHETLQTLSEQDFRLRKHKNIVSFIKLNDATGTMIGVEFGDDYSDSVDLMNYQKYISDLKDISNRMLVSKLLDKTKGEISAGSSTAVVGSMIEDFYKLSDDTTHIYSSSEVVKNVARDISERANNPDVLGIPLGENFPILNKTLLGLVVNKLLFISGRTGHGKTVMANNMIDDLIFNKNEKVCFVSLEMTPGEIVERQLAMRAQISSTKILTGSLEQSEYDEVMNVAKRMLVDNLYIIYGKDDIYELISMVKSMIARHDIRVVFWDYIQLITMRERMDRWQQLMKISGLIKKKVCSKSVTNIALSQLSGSGDDVRDQSGSKGMVNDIDVGITIRQLRGDECKDGNNFVISVDKHRYGPDGIKIPAIFDKSILTIREA